VGYRNGPQEKASAPTKTGAQNAPAPASGADTATRLDGGQAGKPSFGATSQTFDFPYDRLTTPSMTDRPIKEKRPNPSAKEARDKRLADVLRANLKRRKDATRGGTGGKDNTNGDQSSEDS
jgi:hypothetical protein